VWAWYNPGTGDWEADFERVSGGPTVADVETAIAAHPHVSSYPIAAATEAGAVVRWGCLTGGAAGTG
jgi:hypothetical protein